MNAKKPYTIEELVNNSNFINWVNQGQPETSEWFADASDQDDYPTIKARAIQIVEGLQFQEETDSAKAKDKIWANIDAAVKEDKTVSPPIGKIRPLYWIGTAAAACLLALFMFLPRSESHGVQEILAGNETRQHILPDQSAIELTAGSSITVDEDTWDQNRFVSLTGEAFFNVARGESFTVETNNATVIVLGTSFNIKESEGKTEVVCLTGKVRVIAKSTGIENTIIANESVEIQKNKVDKIEYSKIYIPWKAEKFDFENTAMSQVIQEIESSFDIQINLPDSYSETEFTGTFERSKLDVALQSICWPMKLNYSINGKQVNITSIE